MTVEGITESEIEGVKQWAGTERLSADQIKMCVALERLGCNAMPEEIGNYCSTSTDEILGLKEGIYGILVDANTGRFWIK